MPGYEREESKKITRQSNRPQNKEKMQQRIWKQKLYREKNMSQNKIQIQQNQETLRKASLLQQLQEERKNLDSQIKFGELPEGAYTYMVFLTDSNGQTLCFMSDFTVSGSASSTATYWTVQDPSGTKLGQLVQETEEAVAEAVESEAEAVTETKKGMWSWLLG